MKTQVCWFVGSLDRSGGKGPSVSPGPPRMRPSTVAVAAEGYSHRERLVPSGHRLTTAPTSPPTDRPKAVSCKQRTGKLRDTGKKCRPACQCDEQAPTSHVVGRTPE